MIMLALILSLLGVEPKVTESYRGILNRKAPSLEVSEWIQLPKGKTTLDISDFKGKVVYLFCFQSWCPGCHNHGFPTLLRVMHHYKDDPNVVFLAVQTSFEGFSYNSFEQAKAVIKQYGLRIPVGQSGTRTKASKLMRNYRTGGTPWTVIIDKTGVVRFNDFYLNPDQAVQIIDVLKSQPVTRTSHVRVAEPAAAVAH
ncbi:MAG: TlpA family protein disulfide reductase [Calditrichaeota bacterium]|nr:MAG: TlpA family protein disulfide reductase [Calditrichota bacterium]